MKYMKKTKKKQSPVIIVLVIVLVAVAAMVMWLVHYINAENVPENSDKPVVETQETTEATEATESAETLQATQTVAPTEAETLPVEVVIEEPIVREYEVVELVDGQIQTPCCTLSYPEGLADLLLVIRTSQQPYTLEFYAVMEGKPELRLFDISLGEGSGGNMGMIETAEGEVPLNVTIYTLTMDETWSEGEIITAYAMQDVVNDLIGQMAPQNDETQEEVPVISQQPAEESTINNLEIETPYVTLYYPAQWANTVSYAVDDSQEDVYKVHFYSRMDGLESRLLFSVYFGGDEGEQLGAVMSSEEIPVPVYLIMERLDLDGLSDADVETLCAMQEASNQLIARLPLLE